MKSGAVDGVMLDWWSDDASRLELIREVREAVGERAIIIANANDRQTPQTAPFINGYFMECYRSQTAQEWKTIADTLVWAEAHLREPRVNCLETGCPACSGTRLPATAQSVPVDGAIAAGHRLLWLGATW
jgi:hypothetical protein